MDLPTPDDLRLLARDARAGSDDHCRWALDAFIWQASKSTISPILLLARALKAWRDDHDFVPRRVSIAFGHSDGRGAPANRNDRHQPLREFVALAHAGRTDVDVSLTSYLADCVDLWLDFDCSSDVAGVVFGVTKPIGRNRTDAQQCRENEAIFAYYMARLSNQHTTEQRAHRLASEQGVDAFRRRHGQRLTPLTNEEATAVRRRFLQLLEHPAESNSDEQLAAALRIDRNGRHALRRLGLLTDSAIELLSLLDEKAEEHFRFVCIPR